MAKLIKLPGLIDVHVHLRDPGSIHKENFYSGTSAALAGGITTVIDMPNNPNPTIRFSSLTAKERLAREKAVCNYGFYFGASNKGNWDEYKRVKNHVLGLKIYMDKTTGPLFVEDNGVLEKSFENWMADKPILVHAEGELIEKALFLARKYNQKLHCCHVSQKSEVESIIRARKEGVKVTFEVTPHHLFLSEEDGRKLGNLAFVKPPLRSYDDIEFLWKHLKWIDVVATDHAPHTISEKKSFHPPYGMPGLETMLPLLLTAVNKKKMTIKDVVRLTNKNPAAIFGIYQNSDTFVEIDQEEEYVITGRNLKTKCKWTPFEGFNAKGKVKKVYLRGVKVFDSGKITVPAGFGRNVCQID